MHHRHHHDTDGLFDAGWNHSYPFDHSHDLIRLQLILDLSSKNHKHNLLCLAEVERLAHNGG